MKLDHHVYLECKITTNLLIENYIELIKNVYNIKMIYENVWITCGEKFCVSNLTRLSMTLETLQKLNNTMTFHQFLRH